MEGRAHIVQHGHEMRRSNVCCRPAEDDLAMGLLSDRRIFFYITLLRAPTFLHPPAFPHKGCNNISVAVAIGSARFHHATHHSFESLQTSRHAARSRHRLLWLRSICTAIGSSLLKTLTTGLLAIA